MDDSSTAKLQDLDHRLLLGSQKQQPVKAVFLLAKMNRLVDLVGFGDFTKRDIFFFEGLMPLTCDNFVTMCRSSGSKGEF